MKTLKFLLSGVLLTSIISCSEMSKKDEVNDEMANLKAKEVITEKTESTPISDNGVMPYLIPGENNGGNRTCAEVAYEFTGNAEYFAMCGEKVDYVDGSFEEGFPEGLTVKVDGNFISFQSEGCIEMNGNSYKVGAVIVKGSNHANVYFYEDGTYMDSGLAAPGGKNMVSNLTFCFVECEEDDELIVAVKSYYYKEDGNITWCASVGQYDFETPEGYWCNFTGYNYYPTTTSFAMHQDYYLDTFVGEVTISEGTNSLILNIDLNDGLEIIRSWVFVGTLEEYKNHLTSDGCPDYDGYWINNFDAGNSVSIEVGI